MHIEKKLEVSAEEFFDQLLYSVGQDIYAATHKQVSSSQLSSGYTYDKVLNNKLGQSSKVKVKIVDLTRPSSYKVEFKSSYGINTMTYRLDELTPTSMNIFYEETFKGQSTAKNLNAKFMQMFYNLSSKKRMTRMLNHMEAYIIQNRS